MAEQEHGYSVRKIVNGRSVCYKADCVCGAAFPLRDREIDAGLDGVDHLRTIEGRPLQRTINAEAAKALKVKKVVSPMRRR